MSQSTGSRLKLIRRLCALPGLTSKQPKEDDPQKIYGQSFPGSIKAAASRNIVHKLLVVEYSSHHL